MSTESPFDLKFTSREVTAWGGLALLKRMLDGMKSSKQCKAGIYPSPVPTGDTAQSNSLNK